MLRRVVQVVIDTHHDRDVLALGWSGDDDLLRTSGQVLASGVGIGEEAGGLDDDVGADLGPRQIGRIALTEDRDRLAVDGDLCFSGNHRHANAPEHAVVLEQVRQGLGVREVVDAHDLDVCAALKQSAEEISADAAKAIDANLDCHVMLLCPSDGNAVRLSLANLR